MEKEREEEEEALHPPFFTTTLLLSPPPPLSTLRFFFIASPAPLEIAPRCLTTTSTTTFSSVYLLRGTQGFGRGISRRVSAKKNHNASIFKNPRKSKVGRDEGPSRFFSSVSGFPFLDASPIHLVFLARLADDEKEEAAAGNEKSALVQLG